MPAADAERGTPVEVRHASPRRCGGPAAPLALLLVLLAGCASQPEPVPYMPATGVDFSGSWEIDYSRSDDANRALRTLLLRLTRGPTGSGGRADPAFGGQVTTGARSEGALNAVVALARLADEITRAQVLEISQTAHDLQVDRGDDNFALTCALFEDRADYEEGPLATEVCGWDGDRFVFRATLPDGLTIDHRLTLGPEGQRLHIASTLTAPGAAAPFTLNRFYNRFDPLPSRYACEETLTRGRICERGRE